MIECKNHNDCISLAIKNAVEISNKNNIRFTNLRKKVFEIILNSHKPVKAYFILNELQKTDSSAKPSTVYRALEFLLEFGLIHKLHISNSFAACTHPKKHNQCYFLVCNKCDEVKECCDDDLTSAITKITKNNFFKPKNITLEINGICKSCL